MRNKKITYTLSAGFLAIGLVGFLSSCNDDPKHPGYEYMPDMYRSPSYETYSPNPVFKDSMTAQKPVEGTLARGKAFPYPYPNTPEGYEKAGAELKSPLAKTSENLAEGKRLYENFCIHCHGAEGDGNGTMVQNGKFPKVPSYFEQLKDLPEGKMFHTVTYGKNLMGSHASQLDAQQRWKVIQYVQQLQKGPEAAAAAPVDSSAKK